MSQLQLKTLSKIHHPLPRNPPSRLRRGGPWHWPAYGGVDPCHGPGSRWDPIRTQLHADPRPLGTVIPPVIPKPLACGGSDPGSAGSATAKGLAICVLLMTLDVLKNVRRAAAMQLGSGLPSGSIRGSYGLTNLDSEGSA